MMPQELERWATKQINALIARGVNPVDAAAAVRRYLAYLPRGVDPDTYVAPPTMLEDDLSSQAVEDDLRAAWYGDERVPAKYKRLIDAQQVNHG